MTIDELNKLPRPAQFGSNVWHELIALARTGLELQEILSNEEQDKFEAYLDGAVRSEFQKLRVHIIQFTQQLADARRDVARMDRVEKLAKQSRTGFTIEFINHVEDGYVAEKGFRAMKHHHITELCKTAREAIDSLTGEAKGKICSACGDIAVPGTDLCSRCLHDWETK